MSDIVLTEASSKDVSFFQVANYQVTERNDTNSRRLMTVDRRGRQLMFACKNELTVIPFESLVQHRAVSTQDFKNAQTHIVGKFVVTLGCEGSKIDFISVSNNGYGQRLVVSVFDSSSSSIFLQFFDLSQLYSNGPNTAPFCKFRVPDLGFDGFTRDIEWHPEQNSILACVFSNGVFNLLKVDEPTQNGGFSILVEYKLKKISAISWSPKGKQICLGFEDISNGSFAQFKLSFPENLLTKPSIIEEARKFTLPEDFASMKVVGLHWISTFTFLVIVLDDKTCNALFVTVPSPKTPDVSIKISNAQNPTFSFGDVVEDLCFEIVGETIVFYSNLSNNLGFAVSINGVWNLVESTDDTCIVYIQDQIRGFNYLRGDSKPFILPNRGEVGGTKNDFFFTYEDNGILKIYLKVYACEDNFLKVPDVEVNCPPLWKGEIKQQTPQQKIQPTNQPTQQPAISPNIQQISNISTTQSQNPIHVPSFLINPSLTLSSNSLLCNDQSSTVSFSKQVSTKTSSSISSQSNVSSNQVKKTVVTQPDYEKVAREMIAEFEVFHNNNLIELKKFIESVKKSDFSSALERLKSNIQSNFNVGKSAENLLTDLDYDNERASESYLHNILLTKIAEELSKTKPDLNAAQKLSSKYYSQSNCFLEMVRNKSSQIENRLNEANSLLQSESKNIRHQGSDKSNMLIKDIFQVTEKHQLLINQSKEKIKNLLEKQNITKDNGITIENSNNYEDELLKSLNKLKIIRPAIRLQRINDKQRKELEDILGKRKNVPNIRCGLTSNIDSKNSSFQTSKENSSNASLKAQKILSEQNSLPKLVTPNKPQFSVNNQNSSALNSSNLQQNKDNSSSNNSIVTPIKSPTISTEATITLPLKNSTNASLMTSTPINKGDQVFGIASSSTNVVKTFSNNILGTSSQTTHSSSVNSSNVTTSKGSSNISISQSNPSAFTGFNSTTNLFGKPSENDSSKPFGSNFDNSSNTSANLSAKTTETFPETKNTIKVTASEAKPVDNVTNKLSETDSSKSSGSIFSVPSETPNFFGKPNETTPKISTFGNIPDLLSSSVTKETVGATNKPSGSAFESASTNFSNLFSKPVEIGKPKTNESVTEIDTNKVSGIFGKSSETSKVSDPVFENTPSTSRGLFDKSANVGSTTTSNNSETLFGKPADASSATTSNDSSTLFGKPADASLAIIPNNSGTLFDKSADASSAIAPNNSGTLFGKPADTGSTTTFNTSRTLFGKPADASSVTISNNSGILFGKPADTGSTTAFNTSGTLFGKPIDAKTSANVPEETMFGKPPVSNQVTSFFDTKQTSTPNFNFSQTNNNQQVSKPDIFNQSVTSVSAQSVASPPVTSPPNTAQPSAANFSFGQSGGLLNSANIQSNNSGTTSQFANYSSGPFFSNDSSSGTSLFGSTNNASAPKDQTVSAAASFSFSNASNSTSQPAKSSFDQPSALSQALTGDFFGTMNSSNNNSQANNTPAQTLFSSNLSLGSINICQPSSPPQTAPTNVNPFGTGSSFSGTVSSPNGSNKFNEFRQSVEQSNLTNNSSLFISQNSVSSTGFGGSSAFSSPQSSGFTNAAFGAKASFSSPGMSSTFGTSAFGQNPQMSSPLAPTGFGSSSNNSLFGSNIETLSFSSFSNDSAQQQPSTNFSAFSSEAFSGRRK